MSGGASRLAGWPLAAVVAALPAVLSGARAVIGGWSPVIDNAVISVKAADAWHGHLPTVGIYTSLSEAARWPTHLYHPGPLEFWLLAPVQGVLGHGGIGLAVGAAALNGIAAALVVWVVHRLGGTAAAWGAALIVVAWCWALGGKVLHDPWNPHLGLLMCLCALCLGAAVAAGDLALVPLFVAGASFTMQLHLTFVLPCAAALLLAIIGGVLALRRAGDGPRRVGLVWTGAGVVTGLVCWSGPIADQLAGRGNLWNLARASAAVKDHLGAASALRGLVADLAVPPSWLHRSDALVSHQGPLSWWQVFSALVVAAVVFLLTVRALRRHDRTVVALGATCLFALLGAEATVARTPAGFGYADLAWARGVWEPVGVLVWLTGGIAMIGELRQRSRLSRPAATRRIAFAATGGCALVAVAVVALAWPRLGTSQDFGSAGFASVRTLSGPVGTVTADGGPWVVQCRGAFSTYVVCPGIVAELARTGRDVRVPPSVNLDLGNRHSLPPADADAGTLVVASGPFRAPVGFSRVGTWDPPPAGNRPRSSGNTLFLVPIEPVAVYVREAEGRR